MSNVTPFVGRSERNGNRKSGAAMRSVIRRARSLAAFLALVSPVLAGNPPAGAQTTFTYQGRLMDGGQPATGSFNCDFALWDALSAGNQIGSTIALSPVPVSAGLFTVQLDFGAAAFNNSPRWLEIAVNSVVLSPRQPITRTPYALQTRGVYVDANERVGIGTVNPSLETALHVRHFDVDNFGILTDAHGAAGTEIGLHSGVAGYSSLAKNAYFAPGWTRFNNALGAFLQQVDPQGNVSFNVAGPGAGPVPWNEAVFMSADGSVGVGNVTPTERLDVNGNILARGRLVAGHPTPLLWADPAQGFVGIGRNTQVTGAEVLGLYRNVSSFAGMYIQTAANGEPFYGYSAGGDVDAYHYYHSDTNSWRLFHEGADRIIVGTELGFPLVRIPNSRLFVSGSATIVGNLEVVGNVSKGSGSFRIDHPLDPANMYLSHSFVESPDMKNIYDGIAITDQDGFATVELPAYFDALNRDFRYQLTVIDDADDFVLAKVVREIEHNVFRIRTSRPSVKVSWQVTGTRDDAYALAHPIVVEQAKAETDRGRYLHPAAFGESEDRSIASAGLATVSP